MSNFNELPSIFAFPEDQTPWRVDWLGDIAFPDRRTRRKQASVFVHLSRVNSEAFQTDPAVLLSPNSTALARHQRKVWVSIGTLPLLRVGDIWRNGKLEAQPDYELETFSDIQIERSSTDLIKAGLNLDEQGYLIPIAEHPWHMQCTQSYCLMVDLPDERRIIIPCMELIRFYFGSSSSLINQLFLPGLSRQSLYSNSNFDRISSRLKLDLATGISGRSAADIGRMHLDPVAWRAAAHVGASTLAASTAGRQIFPQTFFPFGGKTTLMASGKWLSFGGKPNSTFLVYSLRSCSHPFPFKALRYETSSNRPQALQNRAPAPATTLEPRPRGAADSRNQSLVEQDPSNNLAPKTRTVRFESKFPDLQKKAIWKSQSLTNDGSNLRGSNPKLPRVQHASIGEGGSERRVRPIELAVLQDNSSKSRIPAFLRASIEDISSLREIDVELLTASEHDGWTVPVTVLSNEDGEIDDRLFMNLEDGTPQFRRACVLAFRKEQEHLCAVIIEDSEPHIKLYSTGGDDPEEIWRTLSCATTDFLARPENDTESFARQIEWAFGVEQA